MVNGLLKIAIVSSLIIMASIIIVEHDSSNAYAVSQGSEAQHQKQFAQKKQYLQSQVQQPVNEQQQSVQQNSWQNQQQVQIQQQQQIPQKKQKQQRQKQKQVKKQQKSKQKNTRQNQQQVQIQQQQQVQKQN